MARLNMLNLHFGARTHEGAPARNIATELQLRRSVSACLLWETSLRPVQASVDLGRNCAS